MSFRKDNNDNSQTVRLLGRLDRNVEEADLLVAADKSNVVIDFSSCSFISVEGLEWLEELLLRSTSKKHSIRFIGIPPTIYKVFKVSRIDNILKACGSPSAAVGPVC